MIRLSDERDRERMGLTSRRHVERFFSARHAALMCLTRLQQVLFPRPAAAAPLGEPCHGIRLVQRGVDYV